MVLVLFMAHTGAIWQFAGFVGEDNTRDELKKAVARRYIWGWVDNIEVSDGDIDHLIIAPAGVFAVDSKWHARKLNSSLLAKDVRSATIAAAKARALCSDHSSDHWTYIPSWSCGALARRTCRQAAA